MNYEVHSITRDAHNHPVAIIERSDLREPLYKTLNAKQIAGGIGKHMVDLSSSPVIALNYYNMRLAMY